MGRERPTIKGLAPRGVGVAEDARKRHDAAAGSRRADRSRADLPTASERRARASSQLTRPGHPARATAEPAEARGTRSQGHWSNATGTEGPGTSRRRRERWAPPRRALRTVLPTLAVLGLVVLHPSRDAADERSVFVLAWLAVALVVVATGVGAYLAWRLDDHAGLAWASAGLLTLGLYGTGGAVLALARLNLSEPLPPATAVDLLVVTVAVACALGAVSRPFPNRDPLAVGLVAAALGSLLRALTPTLLASASGDTGAMVLGLGAVGLAAVGAVALLRSQLPPGLRGSLALTFALGASIGVVAGGSLGGMPPRAAAWLGAAGLAAVTTAAVVTGRYLRELDRARQRSLRSLALRATRAEAATQHHQDRMHELRATASGVASASEVLANEQAAIPPARRTALCELLVDETERLRRLTHSFGRGTVEQVALDHVLGRVVGKQRALGQVVRWEPAALAVEADADMLREVVDILLVNAQVHAPGAWVRVNASPRQGKVVVRVRDTGSGVSPAVADRLFERGARGESSEGSGVGLHLARRLVEQMGGSVHHEPTQTGTCFVLTLVQHIEEVDHGAVAAGGHPDARGAC